jgi:hypothetical protein
MGGAAHVRPRGGREGGLRRPFGQLGLTNHGPCTMRRSMMVRQGTPDRRSRSLFDTRGSFWKPVVGWEEALDLVILLHVELEASSVDRSSPYVSLGLLAPWTLIPTRPPSPEPSTLLRSRASGDGR